MSYHFIVYHIIRYYITLHLTIPHCACIYMYMYIYMYIMLHWTRAYGGLDLFRVPTMHEAENHKTQRLVAFPAKVILQGEGTVS